jgi:hypothetical protein
LGGFHKENGLSDHPLEVFEFLKNFGSRGLVVKEFGS